MDRATRRTAQRPAIQIFRNATVTVKVRLFVVIGEVRQVEQYTLKKVDGHWLIDDQDIQADRVIGRSV
jgi:hypothetical protein